VDWGSVTRWTLIIGGSFAAALLAIWVFTGVWARVGLGAAVLLLIVALYLLNRFSKKQAARERAGWERGR
jgi:4-hydroxybenzoate polyprenyltransferase